MGPNQNQNPSLQSDSSLPFYCKALHTGKKKENLYMVLVFISSQILSIHLAIYLKYFQNAFQIIQDNQTYLWNYCWRWDHLPN